MKSNQAEQLANHSIKIGHPVPNLKESYVKSVEPSTVELEYSQFVNISGPSKEANQFSTFQEQGPTTDFTHQDTVGNWQGNDHANAYAQDGTQVLHFLRIAQLSESVNSDERDHVEREVRYNFLISRLACRLILILLDRK
jgi:hypothetical protein